MNIYLPIAEQSMNLFLIIGMGGGVGFLSGMFGVGGGFLMTPLLIFSGIPPAVAVATEANQIVASSVSGSLAQWRRDNVDFKMGLVLLAGGIVGAIAGVQIVSWLRAAGQVDLFISLAYVGFLGVIGILMFIESTQSMWRNSRSEATVPARNPNAGAWMSRLPFRTQFARSKLHISIIPPITIGAVVGVLAAIMGVGGGFIMVPAMIYLLRMPTNVVVGTSLFQIVFVTALVTILHSTQNQTVDAVLAFLLMAGGVVGAQFGARAGQYLNGEQLRAFLALLVLGVCAKMAADLVIPPSELFSILSLQAGGH